MRGPVADVSRMVFSHARDQAFACERSRSSSSSSGESLSFRYSTAAGGRYCILSPGDSEYLCSPRVMASRPLSTIACSRWAKRTVGFLAARSTSDTMVLLTELSRARDSMLFPKARRLRRTLAPRLRLGSGDGISSPEPTSWGPLVSIGVQGGVHLKVRRGCKSSRASSARFQKTSPVWRGLHALFRQAAFRGRSPDAARGRGFGLERTRSSVGARCSPREERNVRVARFGSA